MQDKPIVFFDGVCGLCNRFVDYIISADKSGTYLFAPLQGETFREITLGIAYPFPDSVVFFHKGIIQTKSSAVLSILLGLGGWYKLLAVGYLFPKFFRDMVYDFIARNRYNWFGKKETCRLPLAEERSRFLN